MTSELSSGFLEDCCWFIQEFAKHKSLLFKVFIDEWQRNKFHFIFSGRKYETEIVEFTSEIMLTIKQIFISAKNPYEKIGAFFMMYTIYFKQPAQQFCKLRFNLKEWIDLKHFVQYPHPNEQSQEIQVIFWKMFRADAFRHVFHDKELGYDSFFVKQEQLPKNNVVLEQLNFEKTLKNIKENCEDLNSKTGMLNALEVIETGYNEMKELLQESDTKTTQQIPQCSLVASLKKDMDGIISFLSRRKQENNLDKDTSDDTMSLSRRRNAIRRKAFRNHGKKSHHKHEHEEDIEEQYISSPVKRRRLAKPKLRPPRMKKMLVNFTECSENVNDQIDENAVNSTEVVDHRNSDTSEEEMHSTVKEYNKRKSSKKRPKRKSPKDLPIIVEKDLDDANDKSHGNLIVTTRNSENDDENYPDLIIDLDNDDCSDNKGKNLTNLLKSFRKTSKNDETAFKVPLKIESAPSDDVQSEYDDNYPDLLVPPDDSFVNENFENSTNDIEILESSEINKKQPSSSKKLKTPAQRKKPSRSNNRKFPILNTRRSTRTRKPKVQ